MRVNRKGKRQRTLIAGALLRPVSNVDLFMGGTKLGGLIKFVKSSTFDPV